jgi:hypothetical protein
MEGDVLAEVYRKGAPYFAKQTTPTVPESKVQVQASL